MIDFRVAPEFQTQRIHPVEATTTNVGWTELTTDWSEAAAQHARRLVKTKPKLVLLTAFVVGGALAWMMTRK